MFSHTVPAVQQEREADRQGMINSPDQRAVALILNY